MSLPTVAGLCKALGQHLRPVAGSYAPDAEITAVHVSELVDPTAYVFGGELLLTTGLALPLSQIGCEQYVARLADIGIAALGIGLGPAHTAPPTPLVRACRDQDLPLLVVPGPTPFLTVTTAYWTARNREAERHLQDAVVAHRGLIDAAVSPDPPAALLRRLARFVDGWAALLTATGRLEEIHPPGLVDEAAALQAEIARLEVAGVHSASSFSANERFVAVFPLSVRSHIVGYLAVGTRHHLEPGQRDVVLTAVALLSIDASREQRARAGREAVGSCVATLIQLGSVGPARQLAGSMGACPVGRDARVLLVRGRDADHIVRVVQGWCDQALSVRVDQRSVWFLLPSNHPGLDQLARHLETADTSASALLSDVARLEDVGGLVSVLQSRLRGLENSRILLDERQPAAVGKDLSRLVDTFLDEADQHVISALVAYLRHHGHWERASRDLDVHRNTMRYRLDRAREALGIDLDNPDHAAHLWLQLRSRGIA